MTERNRTFEKTLNNGSLRSPQFIGRAIRAKYLFDWCDKSNLLKAVQHREYVSLEQEMTDVYDSNFGSDMR
jgi:hypothetical protein